jgi:hypothetical protein
VNLRRNFAATPLRFHHAGQRNELTTCCGILNRTVPAPALPFRRVRIVSAEDLIRNSKTFAAEMFIDETTVDEIIARLDDL